MKVSFRPFISYATIYALLSFVSGCGGSAAPTVTSSQDEMTRYLDEHPELKADAKEDTVTASGGT